MTTELLAPEHASAVVAPELDEPRAVAERRLKRASSDRAALDGPRRAAVYRRILVTIPELADAEYRLLCLLTLRWGSQLENCFPSLKTIRGRSGWRQAKLTRVLAALRRKGFIARIPLTTDEDARLTELGGGGGQFVSATGIQFLLPPGVVGRAWAGPRQWSNRIYAGPTRRAQ